MISPFLTYCKQRPLWIALVALAVLALPIVALGWLKPTEGIAQQQAGPANKQWVKSLMSKNWAFYKSNHMDNTQRVVSNNYGGTISEGQSYALARALFHNDAVTFDRVVRWTVGNMGRPHDALIGWKWGKKADGTYGLQDDNNATDADEDIAYYLLQAASRWKKPEYLTRAKAMINDIWLTNVVRLDDRLPNGKTQAKYYINPGTWEGFKSNGYLTLDPSYFAAYIYRAFAKVDTAHPWQKLADNVIPTLTACAKLTATGLPPNWCGVRYDTHKIVFSDVQGDGARDYTWDAQRVYWRTSADAKLGSLAAKAWLDKQSFLLTYWRQHKHLPEGFTWQGQGRNEVNSAFTLSAALALSHAQNPANDVLFYKQTLAPLYNPEGWWQNPGNDYMQSVVWFGLRSLTDGPF
jgi:endoglucanase